VAVSFHFVAISAEARENAALTGAAAVLASGPGRRNRHGTVPRPRTPARSASTSGTRAVSTGGRGASGTHRRKPARRPQRCHRHGTKPSCRTPRHRARHRHRRTKPPRTPRSDEEEGERRLRTLTSGWSDASAYARPRRGPQTQNPCPCLDARSRCAVETAKGSPTPVRRPAASSWSACAVVRGDLGFQRGGVHLPRAVPHDLIDQRPARRRGRWRRILGVTT
jgi:hypothetical protein